jgi:hypothetical protein
MEMKTKRKTKRMKKQKRSEQQRGKSTPGDRSHRMQIDMRKKNQSWAQMVRVIKNR